MRNKPACAIATEMKVLTNWAAQPSLTGTTLFQVIGNVGQEPRHLLHTHLCKVRIVTQIIAQKDQAVSSQDFVMIIDIQNLLPKVEYVECSWSVSSPVSSAVSVSLYLPVALGTEIVFVPPFLLLLMFPGLCRLLLRHRCLRFDWFVVQFVLRRSLCPCQFLLWELCLG